MEIDQGQVREALAGAARRTAGLLRSGCDGDAPARGLRWTVGEVAAHLSVVLLGFTSAAEGRVDVVAPFIPDSDRFPERLAAVTEATLTLEPDRDPVALAGRIEERVDGFLAATSGRAGDEAVPTPWYGPDVSLSVGTATGMLLAEQLVHGYDIATTGGRPWAISPADARLVIRAMTSMLPLVAKPEAAAGADASFDVRVRGGPRFVVRVRGGAVTIEDWAGQAVDCHLSADPVAFVMVAYGRAGQWGPIARGRLVAWGRRPWLALRFRALFFDP